MLTVVENFLTNLLDSILGTVPSIIITILLLIVAFIVAKIAKFIVVKGLKLIKAEKLLDKVGIKDDATGKSIEFFGKLVFILVFLLLLPGILDRLGMPSVSGPIADMVSQILNKLPNIIAAGLILTVGIFIANMIRQLLVPILKRLHVDKLQQKVGIEETATSLSSMIGYVIYVLIVIPIVVAALQVLGITAISDPAISMLDSIFAFLPRIFGAIVIFVIGFFIAKLVGQLLTEVLASIGADKLTKKVLPEESKVSKFSLSKAVGELAKYVLALLFLVEALNVINLEVLSNVGSTIVSYLPFAVSAVVIMAVGIYAATWSQKALKEKFPSAGISVFVVKTIIIAVAVFMTLNQLQIATEIVNTSFVIILGTLGVAFAVAFGVGGRHFASNILKKFEEKNMDKDK